MSTLGKKGLHLVKASRAALNRRFEVFHEKTPRRFDFTATFLVAPVASGVTLCAPVVAGVVGVVAILAVVAGTDCAAATH